MKKIVGMMIFVAVFAAFALASDSVNLGCDVRGPLNSLTTSERFRAAIGGSNPANYLNTIFDARGTYLSSSTINTLRCPLFADLGVKPSASASRDILNAAAKTETTADRPNASAEEEKSVKIFSSQGVIDRIEQPELKTADLQKNPAVVSRHTQLSVQVQNAKVGQDLLSAKAKQLELENQALRDKLLVASSFEPSAKFYKGEVIKLDTQIQELKSKVRDGSNAGLRLSTPNESEKLKSDLYKSQAQLEELQVSYIQLKLMVLPGITLIAVFGWVILTYLFIRFWRGEGWLGELLTRVDQWAFYKDPDYPKSDPRRFRVLRKIWWDYIRPEAFSDALSEKFG